MDADVRQGGPPLSARVGAKAVWRKAPARGWSKLSVRTRLILVATVPQLVYTNVMTWLGNQTLHQALGRMDARLVNFPALRAALHEIYSDGQLALYMTISVGVGLVAAAGASVVANQLRKKLDHLREAAGRIARGNLDEPVGVRGTGEIGQIGEALDDVREKLRSRIDLEVANTQLQQDLTLARVVETMFLPRESDANYGTSAVAAFHRAAPRCSGDIWHAQRTGDGVTWLMLGDVAGTGPGPAMIAAALMTAYRIRSARGELREPAALLQGLNKTVRATAKDRHRVALSLLSLDATGTLRWWSAGMPALFIRRKDGALEELTSAAVALGAAELTVFEQRAVLAPNELVFAFSSGAREALDGAQRPLRERLTQAGAGEAGAARDELARALARDLGEKQREDVTLVVLARTAGAT